MLEVGESRDHLLGESSWFITVIHLFHLSFGFFPFFVSIDITFCFPTNLYLHTFC